jgi:dissimilatory sulfite reductase (desulfoviridin) alpha/beta subunit
MVGLEEVEDVVYEMSKITDALRYKVWALKELKDVTDEEELTELLKRVLDMYIKELTELRKRLG